MIKKQIYIAVTALLILCGCDSTAGAENAPLQAATETQTATNPETAASAETLSYSRDLFAMDTYMTVTAYGENAEEAVDAAADEIQRLDALLSTGEASSEISQINASGGGILSDDAATLMAASLELYQETGGIFDVAIYPVMQLWGFTDQQYRVPGADELQKALEKSDPSLIHYDEKTRSLSFDGDGVQLDFGAIAKGYTSSRVAGIMKDLGISSGLINLGGNVQLVGAKPDQSLWKVGIQDPEDTKAMIGVLAAKDKAVITSGGYERYFEEDGVRYHHIIDPEDGYPADSGLISVTIVSEDGMLADSLSTTLFIMGLDQATAYWRSHSDRFDAILITEDREIYVTEGIADDFNAEEPFEIINNTGE